MVKPIGSSPQSTPVKTEVEQTGVKTGKEQIGLPNQPAPIYSVKAQNARKAEHSFAGQAQAMKLQAELERSKASSMSIPRMTWETKVKHSENSAVPTPYPKIANANQKDESKK